MGRKDDVMKEFAFELGEVVFIDPVPGSTKGAKGLVIGQTRYLDGEVGYFVTSKPDPFRAECVRGMFHECELQKVPAPPAD
jgi:hypothetical protein